jgi:glycosyltransferase involved in cell wall biosynthesis
LPATIETLLAQSHGDFELIINDDCSPDATESVCRDFERLDTRVKYFKNSTNLRYANNQNIALLRASTDYVGIVHDGDLYAPNLVEEWTRGLVEQPTAALVFSAVADMDRSGNTTNEHIHPYQRLTRGKDLLDEMLQMASSPIFGIAMVRRACVIEAGPFDPRFPTLADIDMWMRLLLAHDVAYVRKVLFRAAAREADHHNTYSNWRVRKEHELIYGLNLRRRFPRDTDEARVSRPRTLKMLRKERERWMLACARRAQFGALLDGLRFAWNTPLLASNEPDSVVSWDALAQTWGLQFTRAVPAVVSGVAAASPVETP